MIDIPHSSLRWTLSRLKAMSPAEWGFRMRRKVQGTAERAGIGLARAVPAPSGECGKPWVAQLPTAFDTGRYTRAADRILEGTFDVFALHAVDLGFPPRWNRDPKTRIEAPLSFGKDLDYRDPARVGDIKYLWEINRHLELVTLAQSWHLTRDERYAQGCRTLLDSWFAQSPYPLGVNWCVGLEHAVRLVNWTFAWFLLGAEQSILFAGPRGAAFRQRWLASIYRHCHFIARHWSRHSSANNHLLGEATGLFAAATVWPLWPQSRRWQALARRELAQAALEQTFPDGVNKEQAVWYHHAVADMLIVAGLIARANDCELGSEYWRRLEAMLEFLASIMDVRGNVPAIGDADEGVLVRFVPGRLPAAAGPSNATAGPPNSTAAPADGNVFRSLLATGAVLYRRPEFRCKAQAFDDKSRWLLGDAAETRFRAVESSARNLPVRRAFRDGGYFILGERFETGREVRIVADAGPLGYLSIAAHGHADALSFTLSVAGLPILVDAGTFAYRSQGRWRRYFKGTAAHNTAVVDGEDQSVYGGSFLWLEHAAVAVEAFEDSGGSQRLVASHNGYGRLTDPVRHRRTWAYSASSLTVTDELLCSGSHTVDVYWHFAPECTVTQRGNVLRATRAGVCVELTCPPGLLPMLVNGMEPLPDGQGPLGWHSSAFDVKQAATTAVFAGQIHGDSAFRTGLRIAFEDQRCLNSSGVS